MKKLVIVGDSAFAEIAFEYFMHDSEYEPVAFAVEKAFLVKTDLFGLPVVPLEKLEEDYPSSEYELFVAITYTLLNTLRERLYSELKSKGYTLASYVSSSAFVWRNVKVGENCFIFEDNTVQPFVEIEDNCILWSGNHIGHHSVIRQNCFISSHVCISGFCDIGKNTFIGVNATVANNVNVGDFNWIGPDVTIMKNTTRDEFWGPVRMAAKDRTASEFFKIKL
mgnify:FL=1